jgi:hypothetical protein
MIHSPSQVARKDVGQNYSAGIALGVLDNLRLVQEAARKVSGSMNNSFYIDDPSRGTIYTSRESIRQTARQTATASETGASAHERATVIGRAIADRLIESGALSAPIIIDKDKVGEKVSTPVRETTDREIKSSILWKAAKGVV